MKTITGGMAAHLALTTTSLTSLLTITRRDGTVVRLTSHDRDITFGGNTYLSTNGFTPTAIQNNAELSVDNLDISMLLNGVLDPDALRLGLFDRAEIRLSLVNWRDPDGDGEIKMRRGWFGEITMDQESQFTTELRGLTQALTQNILEVYQPTCRADVGDSRCKVPIQPLVLGRGQVVALGEFYRVQTDPPPFDTTCEALILPLDGSDGATTTTDESRHAHTVNFNGDAQLDTAESQFGGSSLLLDGTGDYLSIADLDEAFILAADFTIDCWIRPASLTGDHAIINQWDSSSKQFQLFIKSDGTVQFDFSTNGVGVSTVTSTDTVSTGTWAHVAVTREAGTIRIFVDGAVQASTASVSASGFDSPHDLRIGARREVAVFGEFFDGHNDEVRIVNGEALWNTTFSVPGAGVTGPTPDPDPLTQEVYENRIYEVTSAGTTKSQCQPAYDTVVDNDTTDGTAVLTARQAFMRHAAVDTVISQREFTITVTEARAVDDWFNHGAVTFEEGPNAIKGFEVKDWDNATSKVTTYLPLPFTITPGERLRLYAGCDLRRATCVDKFVIPNSRDFTDGNVLNFRGEPDLPGLDAITRSPDG